MHCLPSGHYMQTYNNLDSEHTEASNNRRQFLDDISKCNVLNEDVLIIK